jgi:hypothetical protein
VNNRRSRSKPVQDAIPRVSPLNIHVLDGAIELCNVDLACLTAVTRTLARHDRVVIVSYDDATDSIQLHEQAEWLAAGLALSAQTADSRARRADHA